VVRDEETGREFDWKRQVRRDGLRLILERVEDESSGLSEKASESVVVTIDAGPEGMATFVKVRGSGSE
jgi:hypothetical protein